MTDDAPYGYRKVENGFVPNEIEQSTVFWIKSVRSKFPSDEVLAKALNDLNMPLRGDKWTASDITRITGKRV
jgi:hypothetical protein